MNILDADANAYDTVCRDKSTTNTDDKYTLLHAQLPINNTYSIGNIPDASEMNNIDHDDTGISQL